MLDLDKIEDLVDKHGITNLLFGLSQIAFRKAEHLRENWQDEKQAEAWEKTAKALEQAEARTMGIMWWEIWKTTP